MLFPHGAVVTDISSQAMAFYFVDCQRYWVMGAKSSAPEKTLKRKDKETTDNTGTDEASPGLGNKQTSVRVSVWKKRKYCGTDLLDSYLLNQIAKHMRHERLGMLARDLNIEKTVYIHTTNQYDALWEVSETYARTGQIICVLSSLLAINDTQVCMGCEYECKNGML